MTTLDTDTRVLAQKLSSRNPEERASAVHMLAGLNRESRDQVICRLIDNVKTAKRTGSILTNLLCALLVCLIILAISGYSVVLVLLALLGISAAAHAVFYIWLGIRRPYLALMQALAESNEPRMLGYLIDAIRFSPPRQVRCLMWETLELSVAQIGPDNNLITRAQAAYLTRLLGGYWDIAEGRKRGTVLDKEEQIRLTLVIVKLLAAAGGGREMAQLERLARKRAKNKAQQRIQDVIVEVLPSWKARLEGLQNPQTLLRGASASMSEDLQSLLRAAGASPSEPQELLHPDPDAER